jgi:O-acetyl-ADP-ribose deacetylase (regulator of RNase III)
VSNVRVLIGDLFASRAQTLTNTVNTVGVMGKGIALEFRKRFPVMYEDYVARCEAGEVQLGRPYLFTPLVPPWILNFPTKEHWRSLSRLDAIIDGLDHLYKHYEEWGIESLAVPPLGCGEGGLEWRIVGPSLYRGLSRLDIPVELYAPFDQMIFFGDSDMGPQFAYVHTDYGPGIVVWDHESDRRRLVVVSLRDYLARCFIQGNAWFR